MTTARDVLQYIVTLGLVGLATSTVLMWVHRGGRQRGALAGVLSLIAMVQVLGLVGRIDNYEHRIVLTLIVLCFLGSGFFLLLFRSMYLPVHIGWQIAAASVLVTVAVFSIVARLQDAAGTWTSGQRVALGAVTGAWGLVVAEPVVRFWLAANGKPRVQRLRLRSLSLAYAIVVAALFAVGATFVGANETVSLVASAIALALVPGLYAALVPPGWLRRIWRRKEEQDLALTRDLVQFAHDRTVLAQRALDWSLRLVGGSAGALIDFDGSVLAAESLDADEAKRVVAAASSDKASLLQIGTRDELAITVPIRRENGHGTLVVLSGPFTLIFGSDEVTTLDQHGEVIGFALDRVAVTETRRQLEATKTQFLANAAHELRTPLASIVGFSELFADGLDRMSPENVQQGLGAIIRQGRRMSLLINDLLDLTQLELGRARMELKPLLLLPAIEQSVANSIPPGGREVHVDVEPATAVVADPTRLDQVLTNLLTNAFRYGGDNVAIEATSSDGSVRVIVADDGAGVPDDLRPHLFEPFSRAKNSMPSEGSGLGLAIVRTLVEAFGGTVSYEPGVPRGARFVLDLVGADHRTS